VRRFTIAMGTEAEYLLSFCCMSIFRLEMVMITLTEMASYVLYDGCKIDTCARDEFLIPPSNDEVEHVIFVQVNRTASREGVEVAGFRG
jgi:hypothetical protein